MFYEPAKKNHGLDRDPFKAVVVPRPIGWATSMSKDGVTNLAPYSYFNAFGGRPHCLAFSAGPRPEGGVKDTARNIEETGEFVINLVTYDQRDQMNTSSAPYPYGTSEIEMAGLELLPSTLVKPGRVKGAPVHFECELWKTVDLPSENPEQREVLVIGTVKGIHIDESVITDGRVDITKLKPIARLGYMEYALIDKAFTMDRPVVA